MVKKIYLANIRAVLFYTFEHPVSVLTRLFQDVSKNGKKHSGTEKETSFEILGLIETSKAQLPVIA
ncbi:hypothetical protein GCM10020331_073600 [Ectobacillus funiculus]